MKRWIALILIACFFIGCQSNVNNLSKTEFKAYFFYKSGCHACETVKPIVKNESKKLNIVFCEVENMSDECLNVSKKINLHAVPTMAVVEDKEYKVYVGSDKIANLLKKIDSQHD